ncbi:MAG TPA: hypothetical protein VH538_12220, partial [Gaiellaceae bacterium]
LAGASALALGPLGALLRASAAQGATERATDACLDCVLQWNGHAAAYRTECAKLVLTGLVSPAVAVAAAIGCVGGSFVPPPEGQCSSECRKEPRSTDPQRSPWVFPPRKKAPPPASKQSKKRPGSKKRGGKASSHKKSGSSRLPCGGTCKAYCLVCPTSDTGDLCCALPATPDDPNPCCPKH